MLSPLAGKDSKHERVAWERSESVAKPATIWYLRARVKHRDRRGSQENGRRCRRAILTKPAFCDPSGVQGFWMVGVVAG